MKGWRMTMKFVKEHRTLVVAVVMLIAVSAVTAQNIFLGKATGSREGEGKYYQNYLLFKTAYFHLTENKDLYTMYPDEIFHDYYKYSPAFALFMAPFAYIPDWAGLFLWNFINVFLLFFAIKKLPVIDEKQRIVIFSVIFIEMITSIQNSQSNAMIAGMLIMAFVQMEKNNTGLASLLIMASAFIKIFGIAALVMFLFYPKKLKAAIYTFSWIVFFTFIPLIAGSPGYLSGQYQSWLNLLLFDESTSYGLSVAGWMHSWFGLQFKLPLLLGGIVLFFLPFFYLRNYNDSNFRLKVLLLILIWIVIFNYKAESPTFIIAVSGAAIWFSLSKKTMADYILISLVMIFTVLSPTDLFPPFIRNEIFIPYSVKVIPCILVWLKCLLEITESRVLSTGARLQTRA